MDPQTFFKTYTEVGLHLQPLVDLQGAERVYWMVYTKINAPVFGQVGTRVQIPIIEARREVTNATSP